LSDQNPYRAGSASGGHTVVPESRPRLVAAPGVTGRPFSNEINGTLDKIRTITCDKSAKSLRSDQTSTSHQCLAWERRKSHSPQPGRAHQISPFRYGQGWFTFSSGPFSATLKPRALLLAEDLCLRQQLPARRQAHAYQRSPRCWQTRALTLWAAHAHRRTPTRGLAMTRGGNGSGRALIIALMLEGPSLIGSSCSAACRVVTSST